MAFGRREALDDWQELPAAVATAAAAAVEVRAWVVMMKGAD
jgi:hypothetical protein